MIIRFAILPQQIHSTYVFYGSLDVFACLKRKLPVSQSSKLT